MNNRLHYLRALRSKVASMTICVPHREELFAPLVDKTWMTANSFTGAFITTTYTRPTEVTGVEAMVALNKFMEQGFDLKGSHNSLGFLFFYELLTNTLDFKIISRDYTFNLACLLVRMLPDTDTRQRGLFMSVLQLLMSNKSIARDPNIPHFKDDKMRFATMAKMGWNGEGAAPSRINISIYQLSYDHTFHPSSATPPPQASRGCSRTFRNTSRPSATPRSSTPCSSPGRRAPRCWR